MSSYSRSKMSSDLMPLSVGVLALLLIVYFAMNSSANLNPSVGAHKKTSAVGVLRKDVKHTYSCNLTTKTDFVLEDELNPTECIPVVANPSQATPYVNQKVEITGDTANDQFYVVKIGKVDLKSTPVPIISPNPKTKLKPNASPIIPPSRY